MNTELELRKRKLSRTLISQGNIELESWKRTIVVQLEQVTDTLTTLMVGGNVCWCDTLCEELPWVHCSDWWLSCEEAASSSHPHAATFSSCWSIDIVELPLTEARNKYVLVFQDYLTKWHMVYPMPNKKFEKTAKIIVQELLLNFGVPEALLSDRGTNLLSFDVGSVWAVGDEEIEHNRLPSPV